MTVGERKHASSAGRPYKSLKPLGLRALPHPVPAVVGGGGVLGAAHVGVGYALEQRGFVPDLIVGTSVGALNGAIMASWALPTSWSTTCSWAADSAGGPRRVHHRIAERCRLSNSS
ncbi:hypothetical protein Pth03_69580 [Planotetraspora thailandica]|uniref:PNPLA domain-containing protein n=1 Tax=Planotetraspora thailandica TaxID=487172 RepID=A0A8J3Y0I3_9ACTN|nr:patatin-like phospholipase family protein [Planotetraspora thailandica]GII58569.1 hypothetical protein Pth03_69580 [Planotetraspora thailandica]